MGCLDDIPSDPSTMAVLHVGTSVVSDFDVACGDTDFFRVTLVAGRTYEFKYTDDDEETGNEPFPSGYVSLFDRSGDLDIDGRLFDFMNRHHTIQFSPRYSGEFYVAANSLATSTGTTYEIALNEIDSEYIENEVEPGLRPFQLMKLRSGYGRFDALEMWANGISWGASLVSLFGQLNDGEQRRFKIAAGSDTFGSLVTPAY